MLPSRMLYLCLVYVLLVKVESHVEINDEISCKDGNNNPVDWWYIYKLPSSAGPGVASGLKFAYVLPHTSGRWLPSDKQLTDPDSMLQYTLNRLFLPSSRHASFVYGEDRFGENKKSAVNGVMMTNQAGGLWLIHTIPGFPDLLDHEITIPPEEHTMGHLLMCMNLPLEHLHNIASKIHHIQAEALHINLPAELQQFLPKWRQFVEPVNDTDPNPQEPTRRTYTSKLTKFFTRNNTLRGLILYRKPGEHRCVYKSIALGLGMILDVYGHGHQETICTDKFGIRNLDSISVNLPDQGVYYIDNRTDAFEMAVSTGAYWQQRSNTVNPYWSCFSNLEGSNLGKGGMVVCVINYELWLTFDNLKVREPECRIIKDIE